MAHQSPNDGANAAANEAVQNASSASNDSATTEPQGVAEPGPSLPRLITANNVIGKKLGAFETYGPIWAWPNWLKSIYFEKPSPSLAKEYPELQAAWERRQEENAGSSAQGQAAGNSVGDVQEGQAGDNSEEESPEDVVVSCKECKKMFKGVKALEAHYPICGLDPLAVDVIWE